MNNAFKIQRPDHIADVRQYDHKKRLQHLGRVKIYPGQTLWQLCLSTMEIEPVKYDVSAINLDGSLSSQIITREDHLYCVAINRKNAIRKFILMAKQITDDATGTQTPR